ncbi:hypothetical protein PG997_013290 [Apiospora hydei]|uniref:Uncharacterized protein n=1 Tax=Apiospora hydei TaxID=1337664 RepID=A0ABR1V9A0_9PEZI
MEENIDPVPKRRGRPRKENRSPGPFPEKRARPERPTRAEAAQRQRVREAYDANKQADSRPAPAYDWEPPLEDESADEAGRAETRAAKRARRGDGPADVAEDGQQPSSLPRLVPWCNIVDDDELTRTLKPSPATFNLLRDADTPQDLFTWGLRMEDPMTPKAEDTVRELNELLPHPIWNGRLEILRFVLQKAVALRVEGHLHPLGPLSRTRATGLIEKYRQRETRARSSSAGMPMNLAEEALHYCRDAYVNVEGPLPAVLEALESQVAGRLTWASSPEDQVHFAICQQDVVNVRKTLDSLIGGPEQPMPFWTCKVRHYFMGYTAQIGSLWKTLPPQRQSQVLEWDEYIAINRAHDKIVGEPDMPLEDRLLHKRMAFWEAPECDSRIQKLLFPTKSTLELRRESREIAESPVPTSQSEALPHNRGRLQVERQPSGAADIAEDEIFDSQDSLENSPSLANSPILGNSPSHE